MTPKSADKLQDQIAFKSVVLDKKPIKTVIFLAVDTNSKKSGNWIGKMAVGGRMGLRIVYLLVQGNYKGPSVV